jgi:hypothetical protein
MINEEELAIELNLQTAKIAWKELLRFFAAGKTLVVQPKLDLIEVAVQMVQDNKPQIQQWLENKNIQPVSDEQAKEWLEQEVWAVVCKPWVLVKTITHD